MIRRWGLVVCVLVACLVVSPVTAAAAGSRRTAPRLAYVQSGDLYAASPGQEPVRLTRGAGALRPAWSADGRWVRYYTGDQLWIASADGSQVQRVWDPGMPVGPSAWAPRGATLAFVARGGLQVVSVGPDGAGKPREVHIPVSDFAWAPDGEQVVVVEPYGGPWPSSRGAVLREGLALLSLKTGQFRDLIRFPPLGESGQASRRPAYTAANLTWSPDGRWIAYHALGPSSSLNADGVMLVVMPAAGGKEIDVATTLAYPDWVQWRPDSQVLGYIAGSGRDVWQGKELRLGYPPSFVLGGRDGPIGVTPDGFTDVGFTWAPACRRPAGAPPFGWSLATARIGPGSSRDSYGRPLPAIFADQQQVSRPVAPFADVAPHWDCQGRLYWVRVTYDRAEVVAEGKPWVAVDVPTWYYGHWAVEQVLAWWPGPSSARAPDCPERHAQTPTSRLISGQS